MKVYILIHDDGWGHIEIRGVYRTHEAAERARVTRTPAGRRSTALYAHYESCCDVVAREVDDE